MTLFSQHVNLGEKESIIKAMLKCMNANMSKEQLIALFQKHHRKKFSDFVGPDSWTFFNRL